MSNGAFVDTFYAADYAASTVHPIRVQEETLTATVGSNANTAPTGPATNPISASISRTRREIGLRPRFITLKAPEDTGDTGYLPRGVTRIPALTTTFYNAATPNATVTYVGLSWTVVSREAERAR